MLIEIIIIFILRLNVWFALQVQQIGQNLDFKGYFNKDSNRLFGLN